MSFIITTYIKEGIVMASDSRVTYNLNGNNMKLIGVHSSNTADKTFLCPNGCGISTCGDASINNFQSSGYIKEFIRSKIKENTGVRETAEILLDYFCELDTDFNGTFHVAGYDNAVDGDVQQKVYKVCSKSKVISERDCSEQGAMWDGEVLPMFRLLQNVASIKDDGTYEDLPKPSISFNFFTLQDAVDFSRYAVETTINTIRFQNAVKSVGHPIDILIIQPEGSYWLAKKELK